jgi:signal peptidase II
MASSLARILLAGKRAYFWLGMPLALALDQLTKLVFASPGDHGGTLVIVPYFLRLVPHRSNTRGAFSLGPEGTVFYVLATLVGLALVGWFFVNARGARIPFYIGLGAVAGGALGNLVDRVVLGAVRDFIDLHWMHQAHWPIFNLADVAICAGVALLLWETFLHGAENEARDEPAGKPKKAGS